MRSRLSLALLLALIPAPMVAQSVDSLAVAPNAHLRVTTRAGARLPIGTITRQTPDSLVLFLACRACGMRDTAIAWRDLSSIERYAGRRHGRGALFGAGYGLLAGTVFGAIVAKAALNDCRGQELCGLTILAVPLGSAVGLVGGTILGAAIGTDRWVPVPRPRQLSQRQ
ncbi:MAG TPA: hypothetical protein VGP25_15675 [Gemmatimonadaceae bacterium]|nr:hypothetical protein [Gemmatimonadaceae bacterium]